LLKLVAYAWKIGLLVKNAYNVSLVAKRALQRLLGRYIVRLGAVVHPSVSIPGFWPDDHSSWKT